MTPMYTIPVDPDRPDNETDQSIDSTPEVILHGNALTALWGQWPGDINDGFEEAIREMRDSELVEEAPSWA